MDLKHAAGDCGEYFRVITIFTHPTYSLLTFSTKPSKLKLKHSLGAYYNTKNVPSPLGTILLILKRKRPHFVWKMTMKKVDF